MKLTEALPKFSEELQECLKTEGRDDLASQVNDAEILKFSYDDSCNAAYITLQSGRELNVVESNIIGVKHGETVPVEHRYWVNVDTDNFNRLGGIELLNGSDVAQKLSNVSAT